MPSFGLGTLAIKGRIKMIVYMLQYDADDGSRESWSIFYTPIEMFATKAERDQRIADIKAYDPSQEFEETDVTLGDVAALDWI